MGKALLVIDLQNDYFPEGKFPLWNADVTLRNVENSVDAAKRAGIPVVIVQHVATGAAPFFSEGTIGAAIHDRISVAASNAPLVVKEHADSFAGTNLDAILRDFGTDELLICGMMTQNCVTHTALSKAAEKYRVSVLADCCTTVSEILHGIALHGLSTRVQIASSQEAAMLFASTGTP